MNVKSIICTKTYIEMFEIGTANEVKIFTKRLGVN